MGRTIPEGIKEPFEQLPGGVLLFQINDGADGMVGKEGNEVYGVQLSMTVEEPHEAKGMTHDATFFIGIRENDKGVLSGRAKPDPNADLPETWISRGGRFKKVAEKAGVNIEGQDLDVVFSELKGRTLLGKVELFTNPDKNFDGTPNQNAGLTNARITRWFALGEAEVGLSGEEAKPAKQAAPAAGPRPSAAPSPVPGGAPRAAAPTPNVNLSAPRAAAPPVRRLGAR